MLHGIFRWSSSIRQAHRVTPVARNGAMIRHEYGAITEYDRPQAIYHYGKLDKPRVVYLSSTTKLSRLPRVVDALTNYSSAEASDPRGHIWVFELPYYEECTHMEQWQTEFYPTCNILHETLPAKLISTKGSWRTAWLVQDNPVVLKMLNLNRNFDPESYAYHQVDAMAMERLTSSPYSIHSHGFCGESILVEFADGEGRAMVKNKNLTTKQRLKMALDLAKGLDDMHSIDTTRGLNATFVHNDINMANIVAINGKFKYSDFNIGYMLKWNRTGDKPCGFPQRWEGKLWRSPEELRNTTYVSEKADIYSLGNILFHVMTKHQPWTWLEPDGKPLMDEIESRKLQGGMPFFPEKFRNSTDMAVQALYEAIRACYKQDPEKRPTAFQLALGLSRVIERIDRGKITRVTEDIFHFE